MVEDEGVSIGAERCAGDKMSHRLQPYCLEPFGGARVCAKSGMV